MSALAVTPAYAALLHRFPPRLIRSDEQNEAFIEILYELDQKAPAWTPEEQELSELITLLIEDFEEKNYSLPRSTPGSMLAFLMDQNELTADDLLPVLPSAEAVREVIEGNRELETIQIRKLSERFHVFPELFF